MGAKFRNLVLYQLVCGSIKLRFLWRLDQANRCKARDEDSLRVNHALIGGAIRFFQVPDSFVDTAE